MWHSYVETKKLDKKLKTADHYVLFEMTNCGWQIQLILSNDNNQQTCRKDKFSELFLKMW